MLERASEAWSRFWFAQGSPLALALFRILFAGCLWVEVETSLARNRFALAGHPQLPYPPLSFLSPFPPQLYEAVHVAQYPLIAMLALGVGNRFACLGLVALQASVFFANQLNFRNHPYFFLLVLLLLAVSPCAEALSCRRLWQRRAPWSEPRPLTAQRMIQVQLSLVYFFAALQKLNPDYFDGRVLAPLFGATLAEGTSVALLGTFLTGAQIHAVAEWVAVPAHVAPMSWATVGLELFLALGLWWRRTRALAMLAGTGFHVMIGLMLDITVFSAASIATYLLFLEPDALPRWVRGLYPGWRAREGATEP